MDFLAKARRQMLAGQVNEARERLLASFAGLSNDEMTEPGVDGGWSVRDILAHLAAWDRAYADMFRAMLAGERHPILDMDEIGLEQFKQERYLASKDLGVDEALTEFTAAREELMDLLRGVGNAQLFAPAPGDEHADMSIAACLGVVVNDDEEYAQKIEEWREGASK